MGSEMKALMAILVLLCLSSTVLAHDIYSNLRDRDGHLCCGGQDCRPVQVTVLPNGSYYLPTTNEIIPADRATPSPDDRFHQCTYYPANYEFEPRSGSEERSNLEEKLRTSLLRQSASHRTALASRLACPIPLPWHPATGLGVCASCLSCLLVLISPFYEHRPYRTATAETRVLEDKT